MERENYKITAQPSCVFTIKYGPMDKTLGVPFLGNDIYNGDYNRFQKKEPDVCETINTIIDLQNRPKFTLPLDDYSKIKFYETVNGPIKIKPLNLYY